MRGMVLGLLCPFTLTPALVLAQVDYFPLDQVRLLDGPFRDAQDRNVDYLLALDPDRLLAPYLREAGLEPKAPSYGNWENTGLDGHIGGHYVSALALGVAATGREDLRQRLDYMLAELKRAQDAHGDGYLGGVPESDRLWAEIRRGEIDADLFSLNGGWVPWYNLHKPFAGLRDAYVHTGSELARDMLIAWADWADGLVSGLSDEQLQDMLRAEHGGMNEVFADVHAITGEQRYLELAKRFSHRAILDPLLVDEDRLNGLHANTQIPKVIGYERVAAVSGDEDRHKDWHAAAEFFWDTVVNGRSVAIGGNSVREHFHPRDDFGPMVSDIEGPETCNTYNMLRLTRQLYAAEPASRYVDYTERALWNHILGSQDPQTGGLVYFTPMRPAHYRVYSQPDKAMWCCVGSGIENHVKYGEFIYAFEDDTLQVNLFIASRLEWPERDTVLRQETAFPDESSTRIVFETDSDITLALRYPSWAVGDARVTINGKPTAATAAPGQTLVLDHDWRAGDTVRLSLPMQARLEGLPDGSAWSAVLYGPIVLSAPVDPFEDEMLNFLADDSRMGHIAGGPLCPIEEAPMLVTGAEGLPAALQRVPGEELRFRAPGAIQPERYAGLELIPFFRVHRTRYMLYWPSGTESELLALRDSQAEAESAALALAAATIDSVNPGEQQPEAEHDLAGKGMQAGVNFNRHWRHAADWFGYRLSDPDREARWLRITYWGADAGRRFSIVLDGETLAEVTLTGEHGAVFHEVDYPVPETVREAGDGDYDLRFEAAEGSIAGGIYGVRLLRSVPGG